jgi:prevent-host-death family protein
LRRFGSFEAKNKLSELLELAEQGEEILITRHGKEVAKLVPAHRTLDRESAKRTAAEIREMSQGVTLGDDLRIKDLIDEGRE